MIAVREAFQAGLFRREHWARNALEDMMAQFEKRGVRVVLCEAKSKVLRVLVRAKMVERQQAVPRYYAELNAAIAACQE